MKTYIIIVDGLTVGTMELTKEEIAALLSDKDIKIKEL